MKNSLLKKSFAFVLAVLMLFSAVPAGVFAAEDNLPVMKAYNAASGDGFHRYYKQVYTVTFLDAFDDDAMNGALESWDLSANGDGSVRGWMYLNQEATDAANDNRYDVYVAGDGGVAANENTTHMFYVFQSLKEVNGMEHFYTGKVKSFLYWFGNCNALESIDLSYLDTSSATSLELCFYACYKLKEIYASSWNVSNVTTLKEMFYRCYALETADLSGWNTKNVTNMKSVFDMNPPSGTSPDYSLKNVNLSGWDTSNVTTMENMFRNCEALTTLDLSSFDTSKVTSMRFMFYYCKNLRYIYAGEGWSTEAIANINDGVFNCCYALVGQKDNQEDNIKIYNEKHPSAYYPPAVEYAKFREDGGYLTNESQKPVEKQYTVTYEFIGDAIPDGAVAPDDATYKEGETVIREGNPTAEHYIFSGWTTEDAELVNGEFVINNDVHFVGSWTKLYKVEYMYDDNYDLPAGAPEIPATELWFAPGDDVPVYGIPYVPDRIFVGWNTGDAEIIGDSFLMPENDVVLYGYYKVPVNSIEIAGGELTVDIGGEKVRVEVYVDPPEATFKDVIYESGDEGIVTVNESGELTPVSVGTTTITITSVDDPTKTDTVKVTVKIPVTDITVDRNVINLNKGDEDKITVTEFKPNEATNKDVTYVSSNPDVVTVDEDGNIVAVGDGTATITVTSKDNKSVTEKVTVTVKTPVTELTVTEDFTLEVGEEKNVDASVNEDATNKELKYESDNPGVVKIDNDGNVVAVGEGTATITITSKDNPDIKETVTVTVKISVTDITVDRTEINLNKEDKDTITVTVTPGDATENGVTYESSDETVVKVDENGNIEAVGDGTATITITSKDNPDIKETVTVTVKTPVTGIAVLNPDEFETMNKGDSGKLEAEVVPGDATNDTIIYESDNTDAVTVDKSGNVTAVGEGTATITVYPEDKPELKVTVTVTVKIPVTEITVDKTDINLNVGDEDTITAAVTPDNATNKDVTYVSSNPDVVTVDKDGNVTAVGEGEAIIKVISADNPEKFREIPVKVTVKVPDVTEPDVTEPDVTEPDVTEPDVTEPDVTEPDVTEPDVTEPDVTEPDVTEPDVTEPDVTEPDVTEPDVTEPDVTEPDVTEPDVTEPDVTEPDVTEPDVTEPDVTEPDVTEPDVTEPDVTEPGTTEPDTTVPEYKYTVPMYFNIFAGEIKSLGVKVTPDDGKIKPVYTSADESIVTIDADGRVKGISAGVTTISVDFGGGDIRVVPVTVTATGSAAVTKKHHVCFGKTDGIGWYEVSVNGGDFFPQGPNSTLEVEEGAVLVVRVQDMWIDDEFDFYVNGSKVPMDPANTITVVVDGYMLIGALSMDVEVPDVDESLTILDKIKNFFLSIIDWFRNLFK